MSLLGDAKDALDDRRAPDPDDGPEQGAATVSLQRASEVTIDGEPITLEDPETVQTGEGGGFLAGTGKFGRPRGRDVIGYRQIVQTSAMQSIVNGIVDQLLGGDLVFESEDDDLPTEAEPLRDILRDVLTGPHLQGETLDDLMTAAVEDMLGPGNAYWQFLPASDGSVPVAAMTALDPLTIRRNVNENGVFGDPHFYQTHGFGGGSVAGLNGRQIVPLDRSQVFEFSYPRGYRSYRYYPLSAAWQVKEWLEVLANSTTHHNRFYDDDQTSSGLMQVVGASEQTIRDIQQKIEEASGDPRSAPVVGGEGGAQWIEMGGQAVNLAIVEEQKWFYELCLGSLGLGRSEMGFVETTNRSNGEVEQERITKRVAQPFGKQFEEAFLHIARQFDSFKQLGKPFTPTLTHKNKRAEIARQERLRKDFETGTLTLRQYLRQTGRQDLAADDDRFMVTVDGQDINYADHPLWVVKRLFSAAGATDPDQGGGADDGGEEQMVENFAPAGGERRTNGGGEGN
jgi:hypothetical protein